MFQQQQQQQQQRFQRSYDRCMEWLTRHAPLVPIG